MALRSLEDLPTEILDTIIGHYYEPWSLSILDRVIKGTLAIDGLPCSTLSCVSKTLASLAIRHERRTFKGELVFTTACTQWRILTRLRTLSPSRVGHLLDEVRVLRFCSPPLFTNRIPWTSLPGLKRVELDYSKRSANFRAQGTLRELEAGYLDTLIVTFARDSERFDGPVVEDAWRRTINSTLSKDSDADINHVRIDRGVSKSPGIEVLVVKTMSVAEQPQFCSLVTPMALGGSCSRIIENWKIRVSALHCGQLENVSFQIIAGFHEVPSACAEQTVIWTKETGFRETMKPEEVPQRKLVPSEIGLRFG
ncbi:hypothetical protein H2198_010661 [Neophaeococcomyces mojaviensis]|uniref:Uncharacterized protein n=1 Tax=Neophaeococcomyces mojaviensis TaxID=3383035 RepID=A0ACC2ZR24_9EURO|nr:hypothetical protein H2198_010661 [Knufia sp. JES_112]